MGTALGQEQNVHFDWVGHLGSENDEYSQQVIADEQGNVYLLGSFEGTIDADPGHGRVLLSAVGSTDVFVCKFEASGRLLWAKALGGMEDDYAYALALDGLGNLYVGGDFGGTADFDPGPGTLNLTAKGGADVFVCKWSSEGEVLWARSFGGLAGDYSEALAVDDSGNVYVTGQYRETVDFDPGVGVTLHTAMGQSDVFVQKLDSHGNLQWAKSLGGRAADNGQAITVDEQGCVYVAGTFRDTVDFDSTVRPLASLGRDDLFLQKRRADGTLQWTQHLGGKGIDQIGSILLDTRGDLLLTASFSDTLSLSVLGENHTLVAHDGADALLIKTDHQGECQWARILQGNGAQLPPAITSDVIGSIYLAGSYTDTIDLNPNRSHAHFVADGGRDAYLVKLSPHGRYAWAKTFGGREDEVVEGVTLDGMGNVYLAGFFDGTTDFDAGKGYRIKSAQGGDDVFLQKLEQCLSTTASHSVTACQRYTSPSGRYVWKQSGVYHDTIARRCGADSAVVINLTVEQLDTTVNNHAPTLMAATTGAHYQWIDCISGKVINGANASTFTPEATGIYALELSQGACTLRSGCHVVRNVGIIATDIEEAIQVYPNPTRGRITLDLGATHDWFKVTVKSLSGEVVLKERFRLLQKASLQWEGSPGFYLVEVSTSEEEHAYLKVIRQ